MALTSKLIVFNEALRMLGAHPLANLTTANVALAELNGAFDHAVEYVLSRRDWNFARRRDTLTSTPDTSFPPYTHRFTRPTDYLRKCWLKADASDEFQIAHAEAGVAIYAFDTIAVIEYVSDATDNYDPVNWPPQFTQCMAIYLAILVGPKVARAGSAEVGELYSQLSVAISEAEDQEAVFTINVDIPTARQPTIRRALEILSQVYSGSPAMQSQGDHFRWLMYKSWDHAVSYVLERGAWNFATKRVLYVDGAAGDDVVPTDSVAGIIEGFSVGPDTSTATDYDISGYLYGYPIPDDFRHKIWLKAYANADLECDHQRMGGYYFTNFDPCFLEYIAETDYTTTPTNWPAVFLECVAARLALSVTPHLRIEQGKQRASVKADQLRDALDRHWLRTLSEAKNSDAMQQQAKVVPVGAFVRARRGGIGTSSIRRYN